MTAWDQVRTCIKTGDAEHTAAEVLALTGQERREVAKELPGYLRECREAVESWRRLDQKLAVPLRVAGAGCISGAAGVAAWLCRADLRVFEDPGHAPLVAQVVAHRPAEWRADVARRISARLRATDLSWGDRPNWWLAVLLLRDTGTEPPADDAFVLGWLEFGPSREWRLRTGSFLDTLPFLDTMVPRLFETEGVGRILSSESLEGRYRTWAGELTALAADGRIEREMLLDGCLSRFLRGGTANDLRWFVTLHTALEPSLDEVIARARDYLRLLPAAPGPVAALAFHEIRRVDEAGGLDEAAFTEAAEAILFRPEKKLVRAALTWLGRATRARADATLTALTVVFGHEALDLRERAVKMVAEHAAHAGEEALRAVRDAARPLPADLRERIAVTCGAVEADEPVPAPALPAPVMPRELPPPICSTAELAEESAAVLRADDLEWQQAERLLAGLVTFAHRDPEGTRTALERITGASASDPWVMREKLTGHAHPRSWLDVVIRAVGWPPPHAKSMRAVLTRARGASRSPSDEHVAAPHRVMLRRVREAIDALGAAPVLLATPTSGSGHLDPGEFVSRLELLESAGVNAGTADLEQALLRLPRSVDTDVAVRARRLSSPAAQIAANWLSTGGLPDPQVTCAVLTLPRRTYVGYSSWPREDVDVVRVLPTVSAHEPRGTAAELCRLPHDGQWKRADFPPYLYSGFRWWPATMPSHREVIAAHLLASEWTEDQYGQGAAILGLAEADGPAGAATATTLAYGLGARHQSERSASVDALLVLAGRGQVPAAELGAAISTLARHKLLKLGRVTAALVDAAHAGAYADVWWTIARALPELLPESGSPAPTGLPDLIALGARSAEVTGARADIPQLTTVAARGSSRLAQEATRLHRLITSS